MTNQLRHTKPNNWWNKLLAKQQFEFVVDAPPSEVVKRLSKVHSGSRIGIPKLYVMGPDMNEAYDFVLKIRTSSRYEWIQDHSAKCSGFIVNESEPGRSRVWYESQQLIYVMLRDIALIGGVVFLFLAIPDTNARILTACFLYLFILMVVSAFRSDRKLGFRVYEALTLPTHSEAKRR